MADAHTRHTTLLLVVGEQLAGIWHTGIVVYNTEFFFGGGIFEAPPGTTHFGQPTKVIELGETGIPLDVLHDFLAGLAASRFSSTSYNLIQNNCNHFSDEVAKFLTGSGIPRDIVDLPARLLATPLGQMLAPTLAPLMGGYTQQSGGAHEIQPSSGPPATTTKVATKATTVPPPASSDDAAVPPNIVFASGSAGRIVPHLLEHVSKAGDTLAVSQRERATLHNLPSLMGTASGTLTSDERGLLLRLARELPPGTRTAALDLLRLLLASPRHTAPAVALDTATVALAVLDDERATAPERLVALRALANALATTGAEATACRAAIVAARAVAAGQSTAHRLAAASLAYNVTAVLPPPDAAADEEDEEADDALLSLLAALVEAAGDADPAGGALAHTLFVTLNRVVARDASRAPFVAAFEIDFARHCGAVGGLERTEVAARTLAAAIGTPLAPAATLPVGVVHTATSDAHVDELLSAAASTPVIVDFSAEWCGPCRAIAPTFTSLAAEAGARTVCLKVDVDKCPGTAARFSVQAMPTFVLLRQGTEAGRVRGANSAQLRQLFDRASQ